MGMHSSSAQRRAIAAATLYPDWRRTGRAEAGTDSVWFDQRIVGMTPPRRVAVGQVGHVDRSRDNRDGAFRRPMFGASAAGQCAALLWPRVCRTR